jgi:hypothetical protein
VNVTYDGRVWYAHALRSGVGILLVTIDGKLPHQNMVLPIAARPNDVRIPSYGKARS